MNDTKDDIVDIGSLTIKSTEYSCPKHGNIGDSTLISTMPRLEVQLCLRCYIEKMVEIGVCKVVAIDEIGES